MRKLHLRMDLLDICLKVIQIWKLITVTADIIAKFTTYWMLRMYFL